MNFTNIFQSSKTTNKNNFTNIFQSSKTTNKNNFTVLAQHVKDYKAVDRIDKVKKALTAVTNLNIFLPDGSNILKMAIQKGASDESNASVIEILIEAGADVDFCDARGYNALYYAFKSPRHILTIETLLKHNIDFSCINFMKLLEDTHKHLLDIFLKYNFDVNMLNDKGECLFCKAIIKYDKDLCQKLLEHKANPNMANSSGRSLLVKLFFDKNGKKLDRIDKVQLLIKYGADSFYTNSTNLKTFLVYLVSNGTTNEMDFISDYIDGCTSSYINQLDSTNNKALYYATRNPDLNADVLEKLTRNTTMDPTENTNLIENLFQCTEQPNFFHEKLLLLMASGFIIKTKNISKYLKKIIKDSTNDEHIKSLKILLKLNHNKNILSELLIPAISEGNNGMVLLLLTYGADYKYMDRNKKSFVSHINFKKVGHCKIWLLIQKMEFQKTYYNSIILPLIKKVYGQITLNPNSLSSKLLSIKWRLAHEDVKSLDQIDPTLLDYFGIDGIEDLGWKVEAHLR